MSGCEHSLIAGTRRCIKCGGSVRELEAVERQKDIAEQVISETRFDRDEWITRCKNAEARVSELERKAEYAWGFVGRCEVAEGKVRDLKEALREAETWLVVSDDGSGPFPVTALNVIRRALLGSGEEQETA